MIFIEILTGTGIAKGELTCSCILWMALKGKPKENEKGEAGYLQHILDTLS